jgi:hypothetical protein
MRKIPWVILISGALLLASCGGTNSSASLTASSSNSSAEALSSLASSSSNVASSPSSSTLPSSSSVSSSSTSSSSSGALDFSYTLNSTNVVTYENQISPAKGSFFYQNLHYSVTKADPATTDWISLSQGGVFTNLDPLIGHYKTINVTFTRLSEFGSLLVKASPYAVTSPANAAYEIVSGQSFTFPSSGAYFSLYAAVGSFKIENVSFACSPETIAPQEPSALDFYSINDTHGAAEEVVDTYHAGITRLSSAYRQMQFANPEGAILLSSGDMWQGSADSNLTHGELMVNWMNLIGFESMAIGNHEFDWGTPYIESNLKVANFPFLGINIVDGNNERPAWAKPAWSLRAPASRLA